MSSKIFYAAVLVLFISFQSFTSALISRSVPNKSIGKYTCLTRLSAWGLQKLGQPVININNTAATTSVDAAASLFGRRPVTTGNDERSPFDSNAQVGASQQNKRDSHWESISKIDKSFRQHELLIGLRSDKWSDAEKLERISLAASVENLLPKSMSPSLPATLTLSSGGLKKDWDFEIDEKDFF
jgi:hypothetical protein